MELQSLKGLGDYLPNRVAIPPLLFIHPSIPHRLILKVAKWLKVQLI